MRNTAASALKVENTLVPLTIASPPSIRTVAERSVAAEPPSGPDMPSTIPPCPSSRAGRYFALSAGEAYSAKVRIGPKLPDWTTSAQRGQAAATCSIAIKHVAAAWDQK